MNNEMIKNEMVTVDTTTGEVISVQDANVTMSIDNLQNPSGNFYCSIVDDGTRKSKVATYNALSGEGTPLSDVIGATLEIVDVVAHEVILRDSEKGDVKTVRVVLVAKDGNLYTAVSEGVMSSLQRIFNIVGQPSWKDEPLQIVPRLVKTRNGFKVLNLELAY